MRPHPVSDRLYLSLFHYFQDPTYKLRVTDADGEKVKEVDMITNYWFPSLPVFPDNCVPEVHDPGTVTLDGPAPWTVPLKDVFTDEDSMEAAIVKTVTGVSDPDAFSAKIVNGDLVITPIAIKAPATGSIHIKANSNGLIADLTLNVKFNSSGMDPVESDAEAEKYYTLDGRCLPSRPDKPGVYIVRSNSTSRKFIIK